MQKSIVFHVGSIKTGTTSIQKFCYDNHALLLSHDVDYIQFEPPQLHLPRWANADALLRPNHDANSIATIIDNSPASTILVSEEGLMGRSDVWNHEMFKGHQRKIVLYLRNSVELVASWASENSLPYNFRQKEAASGRGVVSIEEGIGVWSKAYRGLLFRFLEGVSANPELEVVIRPFPVVQPGGNLVTDFLQAIGLNTETARYVASSVNTDPINEGKTRKYCDVSYFLSVLAKDHGLSHLYHRSMVDDISEKILSGDDRRVIDTISKLEMTFIANRLSTISKDLVSRLKAPGSILSMPKPYTEIRPPLKDVSLRELQYLFFNYVLDQNGLYHPK